MELFRLRNIDGVVEDGISTGKFASQQWLTSFGKLFFSAQRSTGLVDALWRPPKEYKLVTAKPFCELDQGEYPPQSFANYTRNGMGGFTNEVINLIFEQVEDAGDVACFAVTCQRYYEIGRRHLEARLREILFVSWAGDRLMLAGDSATMDDLPRGMLTAKEIAYFERKGKSTVDPATDVKQCVVNLENGSANNDKGEAGYNCAPERLIDVLEERRSDPKRNQPGVRYKIADGHHPKRFYLLSYCYTLWNIRHKEQWRLHPPATEIAPELAALLDLLEVSEGLGLGELYYGGYVLRNLTTREYVRGRGIHDLWFMRERRYLAEIRFDHALLVRITWSAPEARLWRSGESPLQQLHRGAWAGHRFDIAEIGTVRNEKGPAEVWKDATDEVLAEVMAVFEREAWAFLNV